MAEQRKDLKSMTLEELEDEMARMGEKSFRARQMYRWAHEKLARGFDEMTDLSASFREECKERYEYVCLEPVRIQESALDGTRKYLFRLGDGNLVESVRMQ